MFHGSIIRGRLSKLYSLAESTASIFLTTAAMTGANLDVSGCHGSLAEAISSFGQHLANRRLRANHLIRPRTRSRCLLRGGQDLHQFVDDLDGEAFAEACQEGDGVWDRWRLYRDGNTPNAVKDRVD